MVSRPEVLSTILIPLESKDKRFIVVLVAVNHIHVKFNFILFLKVKLKDSTIYRTVQSQV